MPTKLRLLIESANHYLTLGEPNKAKRVSLEAIKIDPDHPEPHYLLGEALCKMGEFQKSIISLEKANSILPNNSLIINLLGWAIFMGGDIPKGRILIETSLKIDPTNIQALCDLTVIENSAGNIEKADMIIKRALAIQPDDPMVQEVYQVTFLLKRAKEKLLRKTN